MSNVQQALSVDQKNHTEFEGTPLRSFVWEGRPCWITREFGEVLGYEQGGRRLVNLVAKEWADEFIEDVDFAKLSGCDFKKFKMLLEADGDHPPANTDYVSAKTRHVTILFETGVNIVCLKTDKPRGKKLRRFIATEVIPQLVRTGEYRQPRTAEEHRRQVLTLLLAPEFQKHESRFPLELFREIYRLKGIDWPANVSGAPQAKWLGNIITELFYRRLSGDDIAITELRRRNPRNEQGERRHRHHTGLHREVADGPLANLINTGLVMMRGTADSGWSEFAVAWDRAYPLQGRSAWLPVSISPRLPVRRARTRSQA